MYKRLLLKAFCTVWLPIRCFCNGFTEVFLRFPVLSLFKTPSSQVEAFINMTSSKAQQMAFVHIFVVIHTKMVQKLFKLQ